MSPEEIYDRLTPIFYDIFDDDDIEVSAELCADDVEEWDSLSHIRLIVAVERSMGIRFSSAEITNLENVGQFVGLIKGKIES